MPVQMIWAEIREYRNIRCQGACQFCLITGKFQHHHFPILGMIQIHHPPPDITRQLTFTTGTLQNVINKGAGC